MNDLKSEGWVEGVVVGNVFWSGGALARADPWGLLHRLAAPGLSRRASELSQGDETS